MDLSWQIVRIMFWTPNKFVNEWIALLHESWFMIYILCIYLNKLTVNRCIGSKSICQKPFELKCGLRNCGPRNILCNSIVKQKNMSKWMYICTKWSRAQSYFPNAYTMWKWCKIFSRTWRGLKTTLNINNYVECYSRFTISDVFEIAE